MLFTANEQIYGFISFAQHHEDNPTYPKDSATHNALHSLLYWNYKPCEEKRLKHEEKGKKRIMCQVVNFQMISPLKRTRCGATRCSQAPGRVVRERRGGNRVNAMEEGKQGVPSPRFQLDDVDRSAPHKVHKHTGFYFSVNTSPPSPLHCSLPSAAVGDTLQSVR